MVSGERCIKKRVARNPNLKMVSGERCIKKLAKSPNLKMVSGEGCIKKSIPQHRTSAGKCWHVRQSPHAFFVVGDNFNNICCHDQSQTGTKTITRKQEQKLTKYVNRNRNSQNTLEMTNEQRPQPVANDYRQSMKALWALHLKGGRNLNSL